jgi:hypothetical protein
LGFHFDTGEKHVDGIIQIASFQGRKALVEQIPDILRHFIFSNLGHHSPQQKKSSRGAFTPACPSPSPHPEAGTSQKGHSNVKG